MANGPDRSRGIPTIGGDDDKFVTALGRGLQILEAFENQRELGNQQLAERVGLPRATVTRLTYTLMAMGYLRRSSTTGKYLVNARLLGLGASIQRRLGIQREARPHMERLAQQFETTVIMAMRDRLSMVFVEVIRPPNVGLTVNHDLGSSVPLATTSAGLAYLVGAPLQERAHLLEDLQTRYLAEWPSIRQAVEHAHESYRNGGFVVKVRSLFREVNSVSVPLFGSGSQACVFTCAGPIRMFSRKCLMEQLGPQLVDMVTAVRAQVVA